jgi:hypothetical protein
MRNILFALFLGFCIVASALAQSSQDKDLVEHFLKAEPPPCCDRPQPFSEEVAKKPYLAPLLAEALKNPGLEIQGKQTEIIWILGRMGNPVAFQSLAALYNRARPSAFRIRLMTSLGACLTEPTLDLYLDIVVNDREILEWLKKTLGTDCGDEKSCWKVFLQSNSHLNEFQKQCRELSIGILG